MIQDNSTSLMVTYNNIMVQVAICETVSSTSEAHTRLLATTPQFGRFMLCWTPILFFSASERTESSIATLLNACTAASITETTRYFLVGLRILPKLNVSLLM